MIQSFWTDMLGQTVNTQISLLIEEQSDQGQLHLLDTLLPIGMISVLNFRGITAVFLCPKI